MSAESSPHSGSVVAFSALAAFAGGAMSSLQSRANGELSHQLHAPILAALWSFASGWLVMCLGLALPMARKGLRRLYAGFRDGKLRWWQLLGGLIGGCFVAVQSTTVPTLGVAVFIVSLVGGQTATALLVDRFGLGPGGKRPVSPSRVIAALSTFVGVALGATARSAGGGQLAVLPLTLTVLAGAGLAVQGAINGRVNQVSGGPMATTWLNFTEGTILLAVLAGWQWSRGAIALPSKLGTPWWSLVGGLLGIVFVGVSVVVIGRLGVLVATLMMLTGQILSAVALDLFSPTGGVRVTAQLVVAVVITLLSAVGAGLSAQRATARK